MPFLYLPDLNERLVRLRRKLYRWSLRRAPCAAVIIACADGSAPVKTPRRRERAALLAALIMQQGIHGLTGKMRTVGGPVFSSFIGSIDEGALHRTNHQHHGIACH